MSGVGATPDCRPLSPPGGSPHLQASPGTKHSGCSFPKPCGRGAQTARPLHPIAAVSWEGPSLGLRASRPVWLLLPHALLWLGRPPLPVLGARPGSQALGSSTHACSHWVPPSGHGLSRPTHSAGEKTEVQGG